MLYITYESITTCIYRCKLGKYNLVSYLVSILNIPCVRKQKRLYISMQSNLSLK